MCISATLQHSRDMCDLLRETGCFCKILICHCIEKYKFLSHVVCNLGVYTELH